MSLFQNTVLKKYRQAIPQNTLDAQWQLYTSIFHDASKQANIRSSKEEQYQEGFLRELFVNVLGYIINPDTNFNLTTELKNLTNSKKADGAIIIDDKVMAVIELKGTDTTDLGKIEAQAFGYKTNQRDCRYVIISNFEKLRFYIDDATEFVEFNLFTLTKDEFATLWLCLAFENIKNDLPGKLKAESVSNEDKITKNLYKDYSAFRKELFNNIVALNPQHNKLELFKKTQKLLDRFLFIFFAEDRLLLPTNLIFSINLEWQKLREARVPVSLYDRYKMYFDDLNTGARVSLPAFGKHTNEIVTAQYDIYAYNGGLFQTDELLDSIKIDDDLLFKHTKKLSEYDFESEVDVNILGHIFENSLNEIDEIANEIEGKVTEKTKTKRKKDGVFYTPKYITKYIVDNTIGKLCTEKKTELQLDETQYTTDKRIQQKTKKDLLGKLETYRKWLLELTIVDPACGSGAFLNQALEFLIAEHRYVDELQAKLFGDALVLSDVEGSILENNLYGVDLNEESVEIAKLSLWLRTAQRNRKLNSLNNNIKCGNSLIDDPEVAGDKAFNWQEAFPKVFAKGGFDVVIGNPPYVRQELFKEYSNYFIKEYKSYSGKADLFIYFYEKSLGLVKQNGHVSFISSGKFMEASYGKPLIKLIVENSQLVEIIDFKDLNIFEGISAYPLILTFKKVDNSTKYIFNYKDATKIKVKNLNEIVQNIEFEKIKIDDFINNDFKFLDTSVSDLILKIEKGSKKLEDFNLLPLVGIKTGYNDGFIKSNTKYSKDYIFGRDIKKYCPLVSDTQIFFPYEFQNEKYELINENSVELNQLTQRENLEKRAIIKDGIINGTKKWYEFQQINKKLNFDNEYIIYPNVSLGSNFTLSSGNIIDMTGFIIPSNSKYLLCILNSKLVVFLMELYAISRRGGYLEYKTQYISKLPIKDIEESKQQPFIEKADLMLSFNKELQETSQKFQRTLQRKFELEDLPKKLQDWYLLSYAEFIKELAKKKIKLSLAQEAEWEDYFMSERKKALELKAQIDATDKEIDRMVYELYGLTEEEIKIVENN